MTPETRKQATRSYLREPFWIVRYKLGQIKICAIADRTVRRRWVQNVPAAAADRPKGEDSRCLQVRVRLPAYRQDETSLSI
jgi:hypothetical protein